MDRALRKRLIDLMIRHGGNVSAFARAVGTDRGQIHRWLARVQLDAKNYRRPTRAALRLPLGKLMQRHRVELGYTRAAYAAALGVTARQLAEWEAGRAEPDKRVSAAWTTLRDDPPRPRERDDDAPHVQGRNEVRTQRELAGLLADHGGNVSAVARVIGVSRVHTHRLLRKLGLDAAPFR